MTVANAMFGLQRYISGHILRKNGDSKTPEETASFIERLGTPKDLVERSYFQYLCQREQFSGGIMQKLVYFCINLFSAAAFWLFYVLPAKPEGESKRENKAYFLNSGRARDRIPDSLNDEFDEIIAFDGQRHLKKTAFEKKYIMDLKRNYSVNYTFLFKVFVKICMYRYITDTYHVKAIISTAEDSYTSSVLTDYCNKTGVEHIDVMHGEIVYELWRAYYSFNRI